MLRILSMSALPSPPLSPSWRACPLASHLILVLSDKFNSGMNITWPYSLACLMHTFMKLDTGMRVPENCNKLVHDNETIFRSPSLHKCDFPRNKKHRSVIWKIQLLLEILYTCYFYFITTYFNCQPISQEIITRVFSVYFIFL